jgi:hypothetical protein
MAQTHSKCNFPFLLILSYNGLGGRWLLKIEFEASESFLVYDDDSKLVRDLKNQYYFLSLRDSLICFYDYFLAYGRRDSRQVYMLVYSMTAQM